MTAFCRLRAAPHRIRFARACPVLSAFGRTAPALADGEADIRAPETKRAEPLSRDSARGISGWRVGVTGELLFELFAGFLPAGQSTGVMLDVRVAELRGGVGA